MKPFQSMAAIFDNEADVFSIKNERFGAILLNEFPYYFQMLDLQKVIGNIETNNNFFDAFYVSCSQIV